MAQDELCPGCMRVIKKNGKENRQADGSCPYCGFTLSKYRQNPRCLPVNTVLAGKYLVGKVLGEGGFGITYMGYDLNMQTRVAIKEYFPVELVSRDTTRLTSPDGRPVSGGGSDRVISLSGEKSKTYQQGLKKYVDEARNVSRFSDMPGVVSVKDFFYENDTAYIVMEYIEGMSLKEYLKKKGGKLSEEESLAILRPVMEALEKVHGAGIVHRDISPDNIMLTFAQGEDSERGGAISSDNSAVSGSLIGDIASVRLIDFGAARMTAKNDQKSLTIILKHGYAPEEQYRSHGEQGPWTDVYALCAVLYRMLTGTTPESAMDRLFSDGLKRPEELGEKVSPAVSDALMKGLAVKKEDRIQSMRELSDALYAGKKLGKGRSVPMPRFTFLAASAGILFLIVAAVGIGMAVRKESGAGNNTAQTAANLDDSAGGGTVSSEEAAGILSAETEEDTIVLEEEEGEEIAFYSPQNAISGNVQSPILMCMPDGSVKAFGSNQEGQCRVDGWGDVVAVSVNVTQALGLDRDGTVYAAGANLEGECDVGAWEDIVAVAAGFYVSFGLKMDGTVVACGDAARYEEAIAGWKNIKAIAAYPGNDYGLAALDGDGNILFAGWEQELPQVTGWADVEQICLNRRGEQLMLAGIRKDGSIVCRKLTDDGITQDYDELESWTGMKQFSLNTPALGVRADGTVVCPSGAGEALRKELETWSDMEAVTAIDQQGGIYVVGLTLDGQIREYRENRGNTALEDMKNLSWVHALPDDAGSLVAGTRDGRILTYGLDWLLPELETGLQGQGAETALLGGMEGRRTFLDREGRVFGIGYGDRLSWQETHVKQVEELWDYAAYQGWKTAAYALVTEEGTVRIRTVDDAVEGADIDLAVWLEEVKAAQEWTDIRQVCWNNNALYGLHEDGSISSTADRSLPDTEGKLVKIGGQAGMLLGMTEEGRMEFLLTNEDMEALGMEAAERWEGVKDFALGESHVVGLLQDGTVLAAGSNHAGQCDVEDWKDIVYIAAGRSCTLGITAEGELKMTGSLY